MEVISEFISELVVGALAGVALWRTERNKKTQAHTDRRLEKTETQIATESGLTLGQVVEQLAHRVDAQRHDINNATSQITSLIEMQADVFKGLVGDMTKRDDIFRVQAEAARTQTEVNRELLKLFRKENGH